MPTSQEREESHDEVKDDLSDGVLQCLQLFLFICLETD